MNVRAIGVPGAPSGAPLSAPKSSYIHEIPWMSTNFHSIGGSPVAAALAAGLTPNFLGGEREPADAAHQTRGEGSLPGGPGSMRSARPDGQPLLRPLSERPGETSPARPGRVGPTVPRHESGRYVCCLGYGEHFDWCDEV